MPLHGQGLAEYHLKAAFLYRVTQFITWPAPALRDSNVLYVCVSRPNPFGETLQELAAGETVDGRTLAVREVSRTSELDACHLLFVPADAGARGTALLAHAATTPIVTVGETPHFLDEGGLIGLHIRDRRLTFEVDVAGARARGLEFSSQLLRLAAEVRGAEP